MAPDARPVPAPSAAEPWFERFSLRGSDLLRDVRIGLRRLLKTPAFSLFTILTLAIGIGATSTVHALVGAFFDRPLDVRDPATVVIIGTDAPNLILPISAPDFADFRADQTSLQAVEGWADVRTSFSANGTVAPVTAQLVTGGYFDMLGVHAIRGRAIQPADDDPAAPPVVALSESIWRTRFAADPDVVGRAVRLGGESYRVVGVIPRSFSGIAWMFTYPAIWVPISHPPLTSVAAEASRDAHGRDRTYARILGRLRPGVEAAAAGAEARAIGVRLDREFPFPPRYGIAGRQWTAVRLSETARLPPGAAVIGTVVVALPMLVLLVACTNLGNLVLSRSAMRRDDVAIRRALGASRWMLVRAELLEHGLLVMAGAGAGLVLARVLINAAVSFMQGAFGAIPQTELDVPFEPSTFLLAAGAAVGAVLVAGLVPALGLTRARAAAVLGGMTAAAQPRWRGQRALVALQVAASLTLLVVGVMMTRAALALDLAERWPGVGIVTADFELRTHDPARAWETITRVLRDASDCLEIRAAAIASSLPPRERTLPVVGPPIAVSAGAFRALDLDVLAGRTFSVEEERPGGPRVAIVSETFAQDEFGTVEVVGREVALSTGAVLGSATQESASIVGVVADAGRDAAGRGVPQIYVPFASRATNTRAAPRPAVFVARTSSDDPAGAAAALAAVIREADPDLPLPFAGTADAFLLAAEGVLTATVASLLFLALVALALSVSGLYSVTTRAVGSRMREMGVRVALGATRTSIVRLVLVDAAWPVGIGLALGTALAAVGRGALTVFAHMPVSPIGPMVLGLAAAPLLLSAAVACYIPARRAANVDPTVTLKES